MVVSKIKDIEGGHLQSKSLDREASKRDIRVTLFWETARTYNKDELRVQSMSRSGSG